MLRARKHAQLEAGTLAAQPRAERLEAAGRDGRVLLADEREQRRLDAGERSGVEPGERIDSAEGDERGDAPAARRSVECERGAAAEADDAEPRALGRRLREELLESGVDARALGLGRRGQGDVRIRIGRDDAERDEAVACEPRARLRDELGLAGAAGEHEHAGAAAGVGDDEPRRRLRQHLLASPHARPPTRDVARVRAYRTSTCTLARMSLPGPVSLPPAVGSLLADLARCGHAAHVVGAAALALLEGEAVGELEVATSASAAELLAAHPAAVVLDATRRRLMLPTPDGPVDLVPYADGDDLKAVLARRRFALHALAIDADGTALDSFEGWSDARRGRLRCIGSAASHVAADPLVALRALRLVATRDVEPDPELAAALPAAAHALATVRAAALRAELHALLLGPRAGRALEWLRDTGLAAVLAPGAAPDAPRVVDALPPDLVLRLAAWLRGGRAVRALRRLREPRERVVAVERLLHLHPVDASVRPSQDARLRRLARRSGGLLPGLLALRDAEVAAGSADDDARRRVERLRAALARVQPARPAAPDALALDGRAVMEILGCAPGPEVGRALRHLAKTVEADPACNTADALRERLLAWRSDPGAD